MKDIILVKFDEWTKNLGPSEARIKVFSLIRDIPYYLVPQVDDAEEWAASVLETNKASCSPKHYLMSILFAKLGLKVKFATYPFYWDKQAIKYPEELMRLASGCPIGNHVACKVNINDKWVLVDATWDSALKKAGFPVNTEWDGLSDTHNAVIPLKEVIHESLQDRLDYVKLKKSQYSEEEKSVYADFIKKFNSWLENIRKQERK